MIASLFINFMFALTALSLTSGIALHGTSLDKAFATAVAPSSDISVHDLSRSLTNELHVHTNRVSVSSATSSDPLLTAPSHKKHTAAHHSRFKLATLSA